MEIVIKLTSEDLKSNLVIQSVQQMLQANTTINIDSSIKENKAISAHNTNFEDIIPDWANNAPKSNENNKKQGSMTKEERVTKLKKYANSIWASLNEKQKKSLKSFVAFYEKKIIEENFNINIPNQWQKWWEQDKNNK